DEWVFERTLLHLRAVDPSPFSYEGRWYMFLSPMVVSGHAPFTFLFAAPQPWGPWTLHPEGCICSDVRRARCAGAIIREGDRLIRPSQDGSNGYGHAVWFNEIRISEDSYEETPCAQLAPQMLRSIAGVHTYNRAGSWEVIDARALAPRSHVL
ncbi:MAG TPA: hypothetical protein VHK24_12490, partial [Steroidobacter sp.]|nr:hypothetical protein [Steroidobacter sp.]